MQLGLLAVASILIASQTMSAGDLFDKCNNAGHRQSRDHDEADTLAKHGSERKLSRKRRYLIFPEGSSFQLVYDEIIGIVDYTNYLILGITVALAWELPDRPPSEILDDLRTRLQDGSLGTSRIDTHTQPLTARVWRNHSAPAPAPVSASVTHWRQQQQPSKWLRRPWPSSFRPPMHAKYDHLRRYDDAKLTRYQHPFAQWRRTGPASHAPYPWWQFQRRRAPLAGRNELRPSTLSPQQPSSGNGQSGGRGGQGRAFAATDEPIRRHHRIYPVFGKRSVHDHHNNPGAEAEAAIVTRTLGRGRRSKRAADGNESTNVDSEQSPPNGHHDGVNHRHRQSPRQRRSGLAGTRLGKLDRIHIRHHRRTRHSLYAKIEKYLDKRGTHGHHCVLRALCETSQKSAIDRQPGSFLGELMRTIFTIPEPVDTHEHLLEAHETAAEFDDTRHSTLQRRYDAASAHQGDCAARYRHCKESLWASHFVA